MIIKKIWFVLAVLAFILSFNSCATMIHTKKAKVRAASGSNARIEVMDNGIIIYKGTLPAQFPVKSGHTYVVHYTTINGEEKVLVISEKFNGWVIGSFLLGLLPVVVDLVTDNIMKIEKTTVLPIGYSPMIIFGENIPYNPKLRIVGNINQN
jgi:hypothetical protein